MGTQFLKLKEQISAAKIGEIPFIVNGLPREELSDLFESLSNEELEKIFDGVEIHSLSKLLASVDLKIFQSALLKMGESSIGKFLKHANLRQLSKLLASAPNELVEKFIDSARTKKQRQSVLRSLSAERRRYWQDYVLGQEQAFSAAKNTIDSAATSLLEHRHRLLDDLDRAIEEKESLLQSFDQESRIKAEHYEDLVDKSQKHLKLLKDQISEQEKVLILREQELAKKLREFEEATDKQVQQRIEIKVPEYVSEAVHALDIRETYYRKKAFHWSVHGAAVLVVAVISSVVVSLYGYIYGEGVGSLSWQALLFVSFKGLVILGVLGLWAKHAFIVSNAYMHEAIKRADRAHAINFGKLYLEIYGKSVDRKELIDIFENWNIATESAFARLRSDGFDPKILDKIGEVVRLSGRDKE